MKFNYWALKISLICAIVFLFQLIPGFTDLFVLNKSSFVEPWRFLTAIFLHGGIGHLIYNLFALALFGSILESAVGSRKFLFVFFISGILANIFAVNFYDSSLGASGAIFGVFGALMILRPGMIVWAFGIPMPMALAGLLWILGDIFGVFMPDNIGHFAHLAGVAVGLVFGAFLRENIHTQKREQRFVLDENSVQRWEDNNLR
ncbi:MAG: rhomboid family intramembrane serine protease [Nanoarchaeota archaeon]